MKQTLLALWIISSGLANAQSNMDKEAVMKPVKMLFEGMKKGDSALVHKAFSKTITMATIGADKNGKPFIRHESSLNDFLKSIGTPHTETYNEMIWDEKIQVDGNFAQVWTNYAFYLGKKFSHCGVDAFNIVKDADGNWTIFQLSDTRRREGCVVPPEISKQFEP